MSTQEQNTPTLSDDRAGVLKRFMEEMFDFNTLKKAGFYGKDIKKRDYQPQADRICKFYGYKTVYEYGAKEIQCHLTTTGPGEERTEPFITVIPSIYD